MIYTTQAIRQSDAGIIIRVSFLITFLSFVNACTGSYYFVRITSI